MFKEFNTKYTEESEQYQWFNCNYSIFQLSYYLFCFAFFSYLMSLKANYYWQRVIIRLLTLLQTPIKVQTPNDEKTQKKSPNYIINYRIDPFWKKIIFGLTFFVVVWFLLFIIISCFVFFFFSFVVVFLYTYTYK